MIHVGEYHEYIGGCAIHRKVTMMHVGGYHEHYGIFNMSQRLLLICSPHES